ncbi:hypothetical protein [Hyphobacterium sp.]|jgi:uncharacterized membrane protein|uniref:hypothetical protein n=1 Tax=Hyphobacterium sp. TaxID=2004662 RepID=UPI003BA84DBD
MKRLFGVLLIAASVTACATTSPEGSLASQAFDYAPARSQELPDSHFGYEMAGGEPDWRGAMLYTASDTRIDVEFSFEGSSGPAQGILAMEEPYLDGGVRRFSGQSDEGSDVFVMLQAGPCGAGQSYFVTLVMGRDRYSGCATETAANDRWSNYLADWMPAIDLCVNELRQEAEHVTFAYSTPSGTAVRLADHAGNRWECVTINDERVNAVVPLSAVDVRLGEADPIFVRSQMPARGDACYVYESVRDRDGLLIGAFGYDSCAGPRPPVG